jgi:hypothetical protein
MTLQADYSWPRNPRRGAAAGRAWIRKIIAADQARGGDVVLRRGWERGVFNAGFVGAIVLGLILVA